MINHIEYAAANYGIKNTFSEQYEIFKRTLEILRYSYGEGGVVYLNDFNVKDLEFMLKVIEKDKSFKKWRNQIEFRLLPGDVSKIEIPDAIITAHMKHIDVDFIRKTSFVDDIYRIAQRSQEGLEFTHWSYAFFDKLEQIKIKLKIEKEERGKYEYITRRVNHGISTTILLTPI